MEKLRNLRHVFTLYSEADVDKLCYTPKSKGENSQFPYIENLDGNALKKICKQYGYPITIVHEKRYVDKLYRDIYYHYYSEMHFDVSRQCQRLALFKLPSHRLEKPYTEKDFLYGTHPGENVRDLSELEQNFLGVIVIRPPFVHVSPSNVTHTMSRTLLSVKSGHSDEHILSAKYHISIYGHTYTVSAFPFSNQHGDALKCAETCVWEMLEYFGARYATYQSVLPSDLYKKISSTASQRLLPSRGLNVTESSYLFQSFGFESKLYMRSLFDFTSRNIKSARHYVSYDKIRSFTTAPYFHRIFHYCVESGFPLYSVLDTPNGNNNPKHSVVTVGYVPIDLKNISVDMIMNHCFKWGTLYFLDLADISFTYVNNDDNQIPYVREKFDQFSNVKGQCNHRLDTFVVPLPRHVYLDADMAASYIDTLLYNYTDLLKDTLKGLKFSNTAENPIVIRYFLTTVKNFKEQRVTDAVKYGGESNDEEIIYYSNLDCSHFIWVAELSTVELYKEPQSYIFGEIILDATASSSTAHGSVIALRLGPNAAYRLQDESSMMIFSDVQNKNAGRISNMRAIYHHFLTNA